MLAVLGLAACKGDDKAGAEQNAPPPVLLGPENIAIVQETTLATGPIISGSLTAVREAEVRAETSGPVRESRVEAGQRVKAGAVLARLDDTALRDAFLSARAAFRSAEVTVGDARRDLERDERLHQAGAVSDRALEQSRTRVATTEAALADAQARLAALAGRLDTLSPLAVLARGYAVCWNADRTAIVRRAEAVNAGDRVRITLAEGELDCEVRRTDGSNH
jgi:multidrug efflux pump subunit AcrA (membrane-fusion protein)